jgi:probable rRNA maturation factor
MTDSDPDSRAGSSVSRSVEVRDATGRTSAADAAWLEEHVARAIALLGVSGEVRLKIVGDAEMAEAHETYAGVPGTTDVLTFDLIDGESVRTGVLDADIMLCLDESQRQAAKRGHDARRELLLYAIHGILHCLGHDDHDAEAYATMHEQEDRLLAALGVGATFARDEHRRDAGATEDGEGAT